MHKTLLIAMTVVALLLLSAEAAVPSLVSDEQSGLDFGESWKGARSWLRTNLQSCFSHFKESEERAGENA
jgi:hypothetical protein